MINIQEKKQEIINFIKNNGPTLPVRIAKAIDMSPVFTSAILSELLNEKKIKTSSLKIGSSPLYLIEGQEEKLTEFTENLKPIENEAYQKLRKNKFLKDSNENPAIRVALRNIKDFAIPFRYSEEIYWKYSFAKDEEVEEMLEKPKKEAEEKTQKKQTESEKESKENAKEKKVEDIFEKKDEKEIEFLSEVKEYLSNKEIKLIEKIQTDKKEVVAKIRINSNLGKIDFLLIAKNKKTLNKDEIKSALQRASYDKMPCLILVRKEPTKSIQNSLENNNLIKIDVIK